MKVLLYPFVALWAVGLVLSVLVHLAAWGGLHLGPARQGR